MTAASEAKVSVAESSDLDAAWKRIDQRQKIDGAITAVAKACEVAALVSRCDPSFEPAIWRLRQASIHAVLEQAQHLERLAGASSVAAHGTQRIGVVLAARDEADRDTSAEEEGAPSASHDLYAAPIPQVGLGRAHQAGQLLAGDGDAEGLPGVVHLHDKSSSAVGALGAVNTGSLAPTVGAAADSPSSSAGRGVGGRRPRGWIRHLRGRPPAGPVLGRAP